MPHQENTEESNSLRTLAALYKAYFLWERTPAILH